MQVFQKLNMSISPDEFYALDVIMMHDNICQRELAKLILKRPSKYRQNFGFSGREGIYIERFADTKNNRLVRRMRITDTGRKVTEETSEKD